MSDGYQIPFESTEKLIPIGYMGSPIYKVATQIRSVIETKLGKEHAQTLATPLASDNDSRIDWYSALGKHSILLSDLPESEAELARALLHKRLAEISGLAESLILLGKSEGGIKTEGDYGEILQRAVQYPGDDYIRVIGGQPVIVFWGFLPSGSVSLPNLSSDGAAPDQNSPRDPIDEPPSVEETQRDPAPARSFSFDWIRLLKVLALILLLLLLLWLLRNCSWSLPTVSTGEQRPSLKETLEEQRPSLKETLEEQRPSLKETLEENTVRGFQGKWALATNRSCVSRSREGTPIPGTERPMDDMQLILNEDGTGSISVSCRGDLPCKTDDLRVNILSKESFSISHGVMQCPGGNTFGKEVEDMRCDLDTEDSALCALVCITGLCPSVFKR
jgi:hypothetical protein